MRSTAGSTRMSQASRSDGEALPQMDVGVLLEEVYAPACGQFRRNGCARWVAGWAHYASGPDGVLRARRKAGGK